MESTKSTDFERYSRVFRQYWLLAVATFGSVVALTYFYTSSKVPIYTAGGKLLFRQDQSSRLVKFESEGEDTNSTPNDRAQATEAKVISSGPILQKALRRINLLNQHKQTIDLQELQQGIAVTSVEKTDILQVSYISQQPKLAALVVNEVMKAYVQSDLESSRAAAASAAKFISAQIPRVRASVYNTDLIVRNFKQKHQITDLNRTQEAVSANLERIGTEIDSVEAQLAALNTRIKTLQKKMGITSQQAIVVNSFNKSPVIKGLLEDLQEVQGKLADARARYKDLNPTITQLEDKQAQLRRLIEDHYAQVLQGRQTERTYKFQVGEIQENILADLISLEGERVGLVSKLAVLNKQHAFYKQKAANLPRLEQQLRDYQRELLAAQSTYESLLKSLQEIKVIENRTIGNVRIIEAAQVPVQPVNANNTSAMAAGNLAGFLLAGAVIYGIEKLDKTIKTVGQVKELFEYTLIGTIPVFNKKVKNVPVIEIPLSYINEKYRMLLANLNSLNAINPIKAILVTSSVPREGKSTTCANLAAVIAQLGYSALIIDADIRHPSQHQIWKVSNEVGLINVVKQNYLSENIIKKVMNNLYVLTAGVSNVEQPVFLDYKSMNGLIEQFRKQYDYIIIDTPSLSVAADASIFGKIADGVLVVTRPDIVNSNNARLAKESLDQSGQNILGIVVNGANVENEPQEYYSQSKLGFVGIGNINVNTWLDKVNLFKRN